MKSRLQKGFTLIELLVVIAVIGILAAVVLASLNSARAKGKIAAVKSNLRNMIPAAELYYTNNATYANLCNTGGPLQGMIDAIVATGGQASCYTNSLFHDRSWGVAAVFDGNYYGVNSQGIITIDKVASATGTWDGGMTTCYAAGKRFASVEQLKALYDIYGTFPPGIANNWYWSSTEHTTIPTSMYVSNFTSGLVYANAKTISGGVLCGL